MFLPSSVAKFVWSRNGMESPNFPSCSCIKSPNITEQRSGTFRNSCTDNQGIFIHNCWRIRHYIFICTESFDTVNQIYFSICSKRENHLSSLGIEGIQKSSVSKENTSLLSIRPISNTSARHVESFFLEIGFPNFFPCSRIYGKCL